MAESIIELTDYEFTNSEGKRFRIRYDSEWRDKNQQPGVWHEYQDGRRVWVANGQTPAQRRAAIAAAPDKGIMPAAPPASSQRTPEEQQAAAQAFQDAQDYPLVNNTPGSPRNGWRYRVADDKDGSGNPGEVRVYLKPDRSTETIFIARPLPADGDTGGTVAPDGSGGAQPAGPPEKGINPDGTPRTEPITMSGSGGDGNGISFSTDAPTATTDPGGPPANQSGTQSGSTNDGLTTPYTVVSGDTLSGIAARNGVSLDQLLDANPKYRSNPNLIHPGDTIHIPNYGPPVTAPPEGPSYPMTGQTFDTDGRRSGQSMAAGGDGAGDVPPSPESAAMGASWPPDPKPPAGVGPA